MFDSGKRAIVAHGSSEIIQNNLLCATALKNSEENDDDSRQDLLHDVEGSAVNQLLLRCPKLTILIEGIEVKALLDTRSQITCISQEFYSNVFKSKPTLPICGKVVKDATGDKTTRLKRQVLLDVKFGNSTVSLIFIIVPKLIKECIIGYDSLKGLKIPIDSSREELYMTKNHSDENVSYTKTTSDKSNFVALRIVHDEANELTRGPSAVDFDAESSEQLTDSEIDRKVYDCHNLSSKDKLIFVDLLRKYQRVFRKKPWMSTTYTHQLNLKDDQSFSVKPYPIPMNFKDKVREKVEKTLKLNIIRHSTSPYINPVAAVSKCDNSVRLCLDALDYENHRQEKKKLLTEVIKRLQLNIKHLSDLRKSKIFLNNPLPDGKGRFSLQSNNEVGRFGRCRTLTDLKNLLRRLDKRISYEVFIKRKKKGPSWTKGIHLLRLLVIFLLIFFFLQKKSSFQIMFIYHTCVIHFVSLYICVTFKCK